MIALAVILAVLLLLAFAPLGVRFSYDGENIGLTVRIGPAKLRIMPPKPKQAKKPKKEKKPKKPKEKKPPAPKGEKKKKVVGVSDILGLVGPFLRLVRDFLDSFRRHLAIRKLKLYVDYGADDPATGAIRYGQAWAAVSAVMPILTNGLRIKEQDVKAVYNDGVSGFAVEAEVQVRLFFYELLGMGVKYGFRAVKAVLPLLKKIIKSKKEPQNTKKKAVQNDESSPS